MGDATQPTRVRVWWDRTWPWNLGLERLMFGGGVAVMAIVVVIVMVASHAQWSAGSVVWAVVFAVVGGWGLGHWFQGREHPPGINAGWLLTLIEWFVIAALLRAFYRGIVLPLLPDAFIHLGTTEWLLLAPAMIALLMSLSGKLRMHLFVSRLAAFVIAVSAGIAILPSDPGVGTGASAAELAQARKSGEPVVLRDARSDPSEQALPPKTDPRCSATWITDVRRSLLGLRGRKLHARFDVCWDARGHVVSLRTAQWMSAGQSTGGARAIRPYDPSMFGVGFDSGDGPVNSDGPNDAPGPDDGVTIRIRPSSRGDVVDVVTAYELLDARGPIGSIASDGATGSGDSTGGPYSSAIRWRRYPFDVPPGRAVDLVSAHLLPDEHEASIVRFTRRGSRPLANDRGVPGGR